MLRPLLVVLGTTAVAHLLVSVAFGGDQEPYLQWMRHLASPDRQVLDAAVSTLQLVVGGTLIGAPLGLALGLATRARRLGTVVTPLLIPVLALAGPALAVLVIRLLVVPGLLPLAAAGSFGDDPLQAVRAMIAPSLVVGLMLAPGIAALVIERAASGASVGLVAAASTLATRSESAVGWRFGLPLGHLVCGLAVGEWLFARPGLLSVILRALQVFDPMILLEAVALLAIGGALAGLVVDLVGQRSGGAGTPLPSALRLAGADDASRARPALTVAVVLAVVVGVAACCGTLLDSTSTDITVILNPPGTSGHLLGTDELGRDLLARTLHGLYRSLLFALLPTAVATASGMALARLWRHLPRLGPVLPGALVDLAWWPLPVVVALAPLQLASRGGLLHPTVLVVAAVGLVPHALRLCRREQVAERPAGLTRAAGIWFLLASYAFLVHGTASVLGVDRPPAPSLGADLASAATTLEITTWPALWPALASWLGMLALLLLGSSLVKYGWCRAAASLTADLDADDTATFSVSAPAGRPGPHRPEWLPPDDDRTLEAPRPGRRPPAQTGEHPTTRPASPGYRAQPVPGRNRSADTTTQLPVQRPRATPPDRSSWH